MIEKLETIIDVPVNLAVADVDTDQIIPARYLKKTEREGFGANLFYDWRFDSNGESNQRFVLNQTVHNKILLAGKNFGCGSSREHAAWALHDYGFRVVISTFFADIFKENALNNGILPVQISPFFYETILAEIANDNAVKICVDVEAQCITMMASNEKENFKLSAYKKKCLQNGMDDLSYLYSIKSKINQFQNQHTL